MKNPIGRPPSPYRKDERFRPVTIRKEVKDLLEEQKIKMGKKSLSDVIDQLISEKNSKQNAE